MTATFFPLCFLNRIVLLGLQPQQLLQILSQLLSKQYKKRLQNSHVLILCTCDRVHKQELSQFGYCKSDNFAGILFNVLAKTGEKLFLTDFFI